MEKMDKRRKAEENKKSKIFQLRLTQSQAKILTDASEKLEMEKSAIIREAVSKYLTEKGLKSW
jgi:predicted DNA-binding protein